MKNKQTNKKLISCLKKILIVESAQLVLMQFLAKKKGKFPFSISSNLTGTLIVAYSLVVYDDQIFVLCKY